MKKLLLLCGFALLTAGLSAQERLVLYEEFTGENCGPCAAANPGLMQLVNNYDDVLIIKYQVPVPNGGPIYAENTADPQARMSYYGVNFAPYGRIDGAIVGAGESAGHVGLTTPQMLTDAASVPTTVDVEIVNYNRVLGSTTVDFDVKVTSTVAQNFSNAVVHVALLESLFFNSPPGTNGETEFYNVVRKMYPNAQGQALQTTFTANESQTFTISAQIPTYVDPNSTDLRFVAFAQDNSNKKVLNADVTRTIEKDAYSLSLSSPFVGELLCGAVSDVAPISKFRNVGSETITSADFYYRTTDGATFSNWEAGQWTGTLEPGNSTTFEYNGLEGLIGRFAIQDSIGAINGEMPANNVMKSSSTVLVSLKTDAEDLFPYSNTFEGAAERGDIVSAGINGGEPFNVYSNNNTGYDRSRYFLAYLNYNIPVGSQGVAVLPYMNLPEGQKTLEFYVSYAQYATASNDRLDVVYSEDCGVTWTSIWNKSGSELATVDPRTSQFIPNSSAQYRREDVDITNVPDGAYIALQATSDWGNNLFVDNVWVRGGGVSTNELMNETNITVFPNPTNSDINLKVESNMIGNATIIVHDVLGRQVYDSNLELNGSSQTINLAVSHLTAGIYSVQLITEKGTQQLKFTKN